MTKNKIDELLKISKTIKVLYVEDKEDIRESTTNLLERFFTHVDVAVDGQKGIEKYIKFYKKHSHYYDLVISDVNMPHMNGIEMSKAISEINKEQAIVIISAFKDSDMLINLIDVGINKFIQKSAIDNKFIFALDEVVNDISVKKNKKDKIKRIQEININLQAKIKHQMYKNIELEELAVTDKLTGLFNRAKLDIVLETEIDRAINRDGDISIIFIDIDKFKTINDTYGHQVGDQILKDFSKKLQHCIRKTDTIGRWGGEEFLIICKEVNMKECLLIAENLRIKIQNMELKSVKNVTASFGCATLKDGDCPQSLLRRADTALYKSKENGRNRVSH